MNHPDSFDMQDFDNRLDLMQLENVQMQLVDFQCNPIRNKKIVSIKDVSKAYQRLETSSVLSMEKEIIFKIRFNL